MTALRRLLHLTAGVILVLLASCKGHGDDAAASIELRSSELESSGGSAFVSVTASGDWVIELEYPDAGASGWATADPSSGTGSRADVRLRYDPNDSESARKVVMVLKPSHGTDARITVTQPGRTGFVSSSPVSGKDVATPLWLELPVTHAGDGLTFYVHDMDGREYVDERTSGTRNWSFYWDAGEKLSLWVAYPLNNSLRGNGSRSNVWGIDPLIPAGEQPNLVNSSYGGGWTRGHQIPSADRLTYKANVSTFYGTNMTPQEYNFNSEIWASLEGKVRGYAALSDTLYVVTGCQYKDSGTYTGSNSGFRVKVPTHYFKALLFKGVSSHAVSGYMAAGFLLPHDASISGGNCVDYIMSIDELEEKTGMDFFPNLAAVVGTETARAIEAAVPSNWWK
ncbi:MAG: DNA/RNA non-specific endonuclease [Bacteroidales bacterium]|nr:DNA/RNA non-specific endonuclease [Bacteroidales bacterium]